MLGKTNWANIFYRYKLRIYLPVSIIAPHDALSAGGSSMYSPGPFRYIFSILLLTVIARLAIAQGNAFDAESGKILWESTLGGMIHTSTITYAVNGKQYIAVMSGDGNSGTRNPIELSKIEQPPVGHNEIYVFALPE